jgi:hypothetical protein
MADPVYSPPKKLSLGLNRMTRSYNARLPGAIVETELTKLTSSVVLDNGAAAALNQ